MSQLHVEGTLVNNGENKFKQWLLKHGVKTKMIDKLLQEMDSVDELKVIKEGEINDIAKDLGLTALEKNKFRYIIQKANSHHTLTIIDKEETEAMTKMQQKLNSLNNAIKLVAVTKQQVNDQVIQHTNTIQSTFKQLHETLNQRQKKLITNLNKFAKDKKNKLENAEKILHQQTAKSQQELKSCNKLLIKPVELTAIEARKKIILNIAKNVNEINVITKDDTIISNNKINIHLDETLINETINSFGNVSSGTVPCLVSLTDNKDGSIAVGWTLNGKQQEDEKENNKNKLKIEWTETKSNDSNQYDEKWQFNKEYDLNNENNKTIKVNVDNKVAIYLFRVQYFNGKNWSQKSNVKCISVKVKPYISGVDSWDPNCKHDGYQINGNSIINAAGDHKAAYLTREVSKGIHVWRFKIDKFKSGGQCIGIWKTEFQGVTNTHLWSDTKKMYGFVWVPSYYYKIHGASGTKEKYGSEIKNGDIVEMTLNLNTLSLSYKINDNDCGKATDVDRTSYKAAVTLLSKDTKFTLLSYRSE